MRPVSLREDSADTGVNESSADIGDRLGAVLKTAGPSLVGSHPIRCATVSRTKRPICFGYVSDLTATDRHGGGLWRSAVGDGRWWTMTPDFTLVVDERGRLWTHYPWFRKQQVLGSNPSVGSTSPSVNSPVSGSPSASSIRLTPTVTPIGSSASVARDPAVPASFPPCDEYHHRHHRCHRGRRFRPSWFAKGPIVDYAGKAGPPDIGSGSYRPSASDMGLQYPI